MLNGTESIRPLRDRVLVRELPWRSQTATGLHLPDQAQKGDHVWRAVVVAVGPGKAPVGLLRRARDVLAKCARTIGGVRTEAITEQDWRVAADIDDGIRSGFGADVHPGDVVLVSKYGGTDIRSSRVGYGGEMMDIIAATDILGVVEGEHNALRQALEMALGRLDAVGFGAPPDEDEPPLRFVGS